MVKQQHENIHRNNKQDNKCTANIDKRFTYGGATGVYDISFGFYKPFGDFIRTYIKLTRSPGCAFIEKFRKFFDQFWPCFAKPHGLRKHKHPK